MGGEVIQAAGYWLGRRIADIVVPLTRKPQVVEWIWPQDAAWSWDYRGTFVDILDDEANDIAVDTIKELQENLKPRRRPRQNWPNE